MSAVYLRQDVPIGERIRAFRESRGLSRSVLAGLAGMSTSWLTKVERGERALDRMSVLIRLADVLKIDLTDLTGQPLPPVLSVEGEHDIAPAIRRTLVGGRVTGGSLRRVDQQDVTLRDVVSLASDVEQAWHAWRMSREPYTEVGPHVPRLLAEAQLASTDLRGDDQREAFRILSSACHLAKLVATQLRERDLVWMAADRAIAAAEQAEDPLLIAAGTWSLSYAFFHAGRLSEAIDIALAGAAPVEPKGNDVSPEQVAIWGALHLAAALAAARQDDKPEAYGFMRPAESAAERLGQDRNDFQTLFGPSNVGITHVSIATELGDPSEALYRAQRVNTEALPDYMRVRHCHFAIAVARAYTQRQDDGTALLNLLEAERVQPELLRFDVLARDTIGGMLNRERRHTMPQLRPLAERVGIIG